MTPEQPGELMGRRAPRGGVVRAATLLIALTAVSQVLGFVRDAVIAAVFGLGAAPDAYLVAQSVMNLVLALVAGAVARAVVPPVSRAVAAEEPERAGRTVRSVLTLSTLVLLAGSLLAYAGAGRVVTVLAPGFDAATADLAVRLTRISTPPRSPRPRRRWPSPPRRRWASPSARPCRAPSLRWGTARPPPSSPSSRWSSTSPAT